MAGNSGGEPREGAIGPSGPLAFFGVAAELWKSVHSMCWLWPQPGQSQGIPIFATSSSVVPIPVLLTWKLRLSARSPAPSAGCLPSHVGPGGCRRSSGHVLEPVCLHRGREGAWRWSEGTGADGGAESSVSWGIA